jgi:hypothetical protein
LVRLINVYTLSSTKLEIRLKQFLLGSEGVEERREGEGGGKGGVMTQTLYPHMKKKKKEACDKKYHNKVAIP